MKTLLVVAAIVFLSQNAFAIRNEPAEPQAFTYTDFKINPGYSYTSLLNQDGSRAIFAGPAAEGVFDIIFSVQDLNLALGPFIQYGYAKLENMKNRAGYGQQIEKTDLMYGMKAYIFPFYVGFGYGDVKSKIGLYDNGAIGYIKTTTQQLGFTGGLRLFGLGGGWHLGFEGWYKSSFLSRSQNPSLQGNTQMESIDLFLTITLSPLFQIL